MRTGKRQIGDHYDRRHESRDKVSSPAMSETLEVLRVLAAISTAARSPRFVQGPAEFQPKGR